MSSLSSVGSNPFTPASSTTSSSGPTGTSSSSGSATSSTGSSASSSSITGLNTSGIAFTGLASGINTNAIVQGLLAVQQSQITQLQNRQQQLVQDQSAFKTIEAKLLTLQSDVGQISSTYNSVFDARTATSSNQNLVTASASSSAAPGVYSFSVNSLAQAEEVASQGFDAANSAITQGTFQLQVGTGAISTITIDSTNDTLQGLADAINNANSGVTASIINDGSSVQPYRLLLNAKNSGAANTINLTNNLAASSGGAVRPELGTSYIGSAVTGQGYSGTSLPTSNSGAGNYTGTSTNAYTFTVLQGGTVGTDSNIQIGYTDSTGANKGVITLPTTNATGLQNVAQGLQVQFGSGTLVTGNTFTIKAFDPNVQQATDASISVGSGSGALTISSPSNQVESVFPGVTLNLVGAAPGQNVNITVANDVQSASKAIDQFVSDYNDLVSYINQNNTYDAQTKQAGIFLGNPDSTNIENTLISTVTGIVNGVNQQANNLSAVGITLNQDGTLTSDSSKLTQALSGQLSGVSIDDVRRLFVLDGQSNNNGVQFLYASSNTKASGASVQVQVTRAATQGTILGSSPLASSTVIGGSNDTFSLTVNGQSSGTLTLAAGTYTPQALAQEVQAAINGDSQLSGAQIVASVDSGSLRLTSQSYGSASQVTMGSGTALSALGFNGTESGQGLDVAGSFLVNGVVEAATGNGQILTGNSGNASTDGLSVNVTLSQAQITSNPEAAITVSHGIAAQLDQQIAQLTDPVSGRLTLIDQNYQSQEAGIQNTINQDETNLKQQQQSLLQQFTNMEVTISQLQSIGNYISSQFGVSSSTSSASSTGSTGGTLG